MEKTCPLLVLSGLQIYPGISVSFEITDDPMTAAVQYAKHSFLLQ